MITYTVYNIVLCSIFYSFLESFSAFIFCFISCCSFQISFFPTGVQHRTYTRCLSQCVKSNILMRERAVHQTVQQQCSFLVGSNFHCLGSRNLYCKESYTEKLTIFKSYYIRITCVFSNRFEIHGFGLKGLCAKKIHWLPPFPFSQVKNLTTRYKKQKIFFFAYSPFK